MGVSDDRDVGSSSIKDPSSARQFGIGAVCAIAAVAIWAGWLVMMRLGVTTTLTAFDLTALRFAVAGVVLLPVILRRGLAFNRLGWPGFTAVVVGAGAPVPLLIGAGLSFAPVAHASVLTYGIAPLIVACLAGVALKERLAPIQKSGVVLVGLGGLVIGGLDLLSFDGRQSIGHLLFLTADCLWAWYAMVMRRARLDGLHAAAIAGVVSMFAYLPLYLTFFDNRLLEVSPTDLVGQAFYQGVVTAAVSLALFGRSIVLLGASKAAAFVALTPVMAALIGIPALGEWPTSVDWLAIGMITAGVYLASGTPVPGWTAKIPHTTGRGSSPARSQAEPLACRKLERTERSVGVSHPRRSRPTVDLHPDEAKAAVSCSCRQDWLREMPSAHGKGNGCAQLPLR